MSDVRLSGLTAAQRAQLLARIRKAPDTVDGPVPLARSRPPLASPMQRQLWFMTALAGQVPAHNVTIAFRLTGPLDTSALHCALDEVYLHHEILRSRLVLDGADLVQQITSSDPHAVELPVITAPNRAWFDRRCASFARTRFDLERGPLTRAELVRLSEQDHMLLWAAHHAVVDGWSVGVIVDDLAARYRADVALLGRPEAAPLGRPKAAPAARGVTYADVAAWQHERLTGGWLAGHLDFWRRYLKGAQPAAIPPDLPRPPVQTFRGGLVRFSVPARAADAVRALARDLAATPFAVVLATYAALVHDRTGSSDMLIGTPFAGRSRREVERVVGPLSETLPVRVKLSADTSFAEMVVRVRDELLEVAAHQEVPFAWLAALSEGDRDASRNPLFQTLVNVGNLPRGGEPVTLADGLMLVATPVPNGTVRLDLELTLDSDRGGLRGRLEFNSALYRTATAEALAQRFVDLLVAGVGAPHLAVGKLPPGFAPHPRRCPVVLGLDEGESASKPPARS